MDNYKPNPKVKVLGKPVELDTSPFSDNNKFEVIEPADSGIMQIPDDGPMQLEKKSYKRGKLDYKIMKKMQNYLLAGNYDEIVCDLVGISRKTYYEWYKLGKNAKDIESDNPADEIYMDFYDMVNNAKAWAENRVVWIVTKSLTKEPKLALEWAKTRYSNRYGNKTSVEVSGPGGKPIEISNESDANREAKEIENAKRIEEILAKYRLPEPSEETTPEEFESSENIIPEE